MESGLLTIGKNRRNFSRYFFLNSSLLRIRNNGNVMKIIGLITDFNAIISLIMRLMRYMDDAKIKNIITLK